MKVEIYAVANRGNSEIKREPIGSAYVKVSGNDNNALSMSAERHDFFKRKMWKVLGSCGKGKNESQHLEIELDGKHFKCTWGGYPAEGFIYYVHFKEA